MALAELDSRSSLGSDVVRAVWQMWQRDYTRPTFREATSLSAAWVDLREVRVIVARLGSLTRISAPSLKITVDADSFDQAWECFLNHASRRHDSAWLAFNVGATLRQEIAEGLDADPDEEWPEPESSEDA